MDELSCCLLLLLLLLPGAGEVAAPPPPRVTVGDLVGLAAMGRLDGANVGELSIAQKKEKES